MKRVVSILLVIMMLFGMGLEVFAEDVPHVHTPGEWTTIQDPTSEADGIRETECTTCHQTYTEPIHTWNQDYTIDVYPTYESSGSKSIHCAVCNAIKEGIEISVPVLTLGVPDISAEKNGFDQIIINWDPVEGATGYRIYRKTNSTGNLAWTYTITGGDITSYADNDVICGKSYTYAVAATCGGATGEQSRTVTAKTALQTPSVETASAGYNKIKISWNQIDGADGYIVYRKSSPSGSWSRVQKITNPTTLSCTDSKSIVPGVTYYYTVKAYRNYPNDVEGYSAYHSGIPGKAMLSAPTVKTSSSYNKVTVSWAQVDGASGYRIYRRTGNGDWARIATVGASTLSYADTKMTYGTTYYYTVRAYRTVSGNAVLSPYNTTGVKGRAYLGTPSLKSVSAAAYNKIKVTWGTVSGARGYYVYRRLPGNSWSRIATVTGQSSYTYTDTTVPTGTPCTYTVKAYSTVNGKTVAGGYNTKGLTATTKLSTPSLKSASSAAYNKIKVTWGTVAGANGYLVYRKTDGGNWKKIKTVTGQSSYTYTDATALTGVSYTYTVKAYRKVEREYVYSAYNTAGITGKAYLSKPALVGVEYGQYVDNESYVYPYLKTTWKAVAGASGYAVYRKTASTDWERIATTGSQTTSRRDYDVSAGVTYYYTVRAFRTVNGVNVYSGYDTAGVKRRMPYDPNFSVISLDQAFYDTPVVVLRIQNYGSRTLRFYSSEAELIDDYGDYDELTLINPDTYRAVSYIDVPANTEVDLVFMTKDYIDYGITTDYYPTSTVCVRFKYDGVHYVEYASSYYGNQIYYY